MTWIYARRLRSVFPAAETSGTAAASPYNSDVIVIRDAIHESSALFALLGLIKLSNLDNLFFNSTAILTREIVFRHYIALKAF
jgi:hypothetical protein